MKDKQKKLVLHLIEQSSYKSANYLADFLGISTRTVKTYIKDINLLADKKVILSTNKGYIIDKTQANKLLSQQSTIPQYYSERAIYIIKKILVEHQEPDIFDLCNQLLIGYSTLKSDLTKMNVTFKKFNIRFVTENERIKIVGAEKDKRSLLSNVIFEEASSRIIDARILGESFDPEFISTISKIIKESFSSDQFYINDFSFMNLVLHFAILVDRVCKGNYLESANLIMEEFSDSDESVKLIQQVVSKLEGAFSIHLTTNEINEVFSLFKTKVTYRISDNHLKLAELVGDEYLKTIYDIIGEVHDLYSIDLNSDPFIIPFGLHLKSLVTRASLNKSNKNPLLETIKRDCPIIYDMAIFISLRLSDIFKIEINEDEIAFIAIHIGTEIDRQKEDTDKIKCVLLCPDYLGASNKIYTTLIKEFSDDITIDKVVNSYDKLSNYTFDLLISVVDDPQNALYPYLLIYPFKLEDQKKVIYDTVYGIKQKKKSEILFSNFDKYFSEENFYLVNDISKDEVINQICDSMIQQDLVSYSFKRNVFEREIASSTSFGNIAIPHSVHMNALQTSIGVAISSKGIKWGENSVNVILLIAINKLDRQRFLAIYESIISLFDSEKVVDMLKNSKEFKEFKSIILSNL